IALQVSYLGWNYYGFTSSNAHTEKTNPTVQGQLMKALLQAKLIQDPDSCEFTLSGRTDTGVSGMGQVIALNVRKTSGSDLPYLRMLNSALPPDIRVLGWTPVPDSFNARFDCRSRTYHYYFPANNDICIDRIRKAATYLLGEHDFRNFCKFNPSKNLAHYRRTILSVNVTTTTSADKHRPSFARLEIKGTAFLWHQVRCIVSILLLVGQRLEEPEVVQWLLDVDRVPGKPEYPLASSLPLVLYEC
ncbi:pseudouridine synthase, partial [Zychaea mexicana]|uniref:pseudouridine synthase n=1 Tax=Zychaea mexicana TaxID=64656 RepID=UPI0022FF3153